ncbi:MAG: hypothetical protein ACRELW_02945 [Candidatus Rokuibacteriota bacterium]
MAKVGRVCHGPPGRRVLLRHARRGREGRRQRSKGGFKGGLLTVGLSKLMGFSPERISTCDLDTPKGQSIVQWLTLGAEPGTAATPLWGLVQFVKEAGTLSELRTRCAALMAGH